MSGFEVAGVVIGALPLVITALSAYKQGKEVLASLRKFRGLLDGLIHQLQTQKTAFYLDILEHLREAMVPEILQYGDPTEEKCVGILLDAKTGTQMHDYLGPLHEPFLEIFGYYEKYLKEITSQLDYIVRLKDAPKDDLPNIIRASKIQNASLVFKGRLKFTIDRKTLDALVKDLGTERYSLGKLIKRVKTKREWEANEPTSSSTTLTLAFARVRESATLLHKDSLEVPTITVTETCDQLIHATARVQVKSICDDAQHSRNQGRVLALELMSDALGLSEAKHKPHQSYNISTTLADFLRDTAQDEDARMSPLNQTLLALNVVSSVLQLRPTVWCNIPWNSMSIRFPIRLEDDLRIPVCAPYVELASDANLLQSHTCSPKFDHDSCQDDHARDGHSTVGDITSQVHGGLGNKEPTRRHGNIHGPDACCHLLVGVEHEQIIASPCQGD